MSSLGDTTRDQLTQHILHSSQILKNIRLYSIWFFEQKIFVYFYKMHQSSKGMFPPSEKYGSHGVKFGNTGCPKKHESWWIVWNVSMTCKLFYTTETNKE